MTGGSGSTLNRLVVLVLLGAFALILIEVRYLHDEVLGEHAIAWTPIVYSGLMTAAIVIGLPLWHRGGRRALFWAFAPAVVIGPVGYWFHNEGRPLEGLKSELAVWAHPLGHPEAGADQPEAGQAAGAQHSHEEEHAGGGGPPALAPLAIAGLGVLGMLACARRLQTGPPGPGVA